VTSTRPSSYVVHTTTFEGPLDLLVQLAQQGEVDLQTLPLAELARDVLARVREGFDLDDATETLWLLSALVELKARALLPRPPAPPEPVTPEESAADLDALLEERLRAYRAFKDAATALRVLEAYRRRVFARPPGEPPDEALLAGVSLDDLLAAFHRVLARSREAPPPTIEPEGITVAERMAALLALLRTHPGGVLFERLFPAEATRLEVVVTFLAVLELIRLRRVQVQAGDDGALQVRLSRHGEDAGT